jgi:hypothetical protein
MKDYHIYLIENLENLNKIVGFVNIKEKFVNNSFVDEAHILLCLSEDFTYRKEIPLAKIQHCLIKGHGLTVPQYTDKYANEVNLINQYLDISKDVLSWLEILQVATLIQDKIKDDKNDKIINDAINDLNIFKKIIEQKY